MFARHCQVYIPLHAPSLCQIKLSEHSHNAKPSLVDSVGKMQVSCVRSQCLTPNDGKDDVHAGFAKLLSEFNNPHADYALFIANRLYGEQSYVFLKVCTCVKVFHNQMIIPP